MFVTRKFPPSVGGMETLAEGLWRSLSAADGRSVLVAHGGSNRRLAAWYPAALLRLAGLLLRRRVGAVLAGDALTYALAAPLARLAGAGHATMVMGLDVTWPNRCYQRLIRPALRTAPAVIAISAATARAATAAGVPEDRIHVLRLGVAAPEATTGPATRAALIDRLGLGEDPFVLVTLGRLVRRKGVAWFVEAVLPRLADRVHYVVGGSGPEDREIRARATAAGVSARVHLLGRVDDRLREELLGGGDVFVQPNIAVAGDMEGFGLVTVEAAVRGALVVASALEGVVDAVIDGRTGILVPPGDPDRWVETLAGLEGDPERARRLAQRYRSEAAATFSEPAMGRELCRLLAIGRPQA